MKERKKERKRKNAKLEEDTSVENLKSFIIGGFLR